MSLRFLSSLWNLYDPPAENAPPTQPRSDPPPLPAKKKGRKPGPWFDYWIAHMQGSQQHYQSLSTARKTALKKEVEKTMNPPPPPPPPQSTEPQPTEEEGAKKIGREGRQLWRVNATSVLTPETCNLYGISMDIKPEETIETFLKQTDVMHYFNKIGKT